VGERLLNANQYGQAEAIFRIVVRAREKALGPENAETISSLQELANTLLRSKKYGEASEIWKRLLATSENLHGPEAQENVKYIWGVTDSLRLDGKNVEADHLCQQLLPRLISQSPAREGHDQEILDARIQHAALLKSQGYLLIRQRKWVDAEEVSRRLIQLRDLINPSGERAIEALTKIAA
jgi:tetratricopeptide (TPR) repeat protein